MRRWVYNVVSVIFTLLKFSVLKVFHRKSFKFHWVERFSPNTDVRFIGSGEIILGKYLTARSGTKLIVTGKGKLEIGENSRFNHGCIVTSMNKIKIGKGVGFGPNVLMYDHDHDFRSPSGFKRNFKKGEIEIGDYCWIGANTVILKNTVLGKNCVVAAGSVISGTFPDNTLIVQKRETIYTEIIRN